jgi:serine protease inhibitor
MCFARSTRISMDVYQARLLASVVILTALAGCQGTSNSIEPVPQKSRFVVPLPSVRPTSAEREDVVAIARANNAFAVSLYHHARKQPGNLLVSPACLAGGLAAVQLGARGETAKQIGRVIRLPDGLAPDDRAYRTLIQELNADAEDRSYQIRSANGVWIQQGYSVLDSYRAALKGVVATEINLVDFSGRPNEACRVVNTWVGSHTGGKITDILQPDNLPARTRLILTSCLYFRANWRKRFSTELTVLDAFHVAENQTVTVPMMNDHSYSVIHGYFDAGWFQALELPCGSAGEFAMVLLLPRKVDDLTDLETAMTTDTLDSWWPRFKRPDSIIIALPKFRIRANAMLKDLLSELGMPLAFASQADFSAINGKNRDLFLSAASHAAFVDVHEEGIEAAAAAAAISPDSFGEETPEFRADRPFVFLIRNTQSNRIVFLGRVVNPQNQTYELSDRPDN